MAKKKLLSETQVRRFMGLAGLNPLSENYMMDEKEEEMMEQETPVTEVEAPVVEEEEAELPAPEEEAPMADMEDMEDEGPMGDESEKDIISMAFSSSKAEYSIRILDSGLSSPPPPMSIAIRSSFLSSFFSSFFFPLSSFSSSWSSDLSDPLPNVIILFIKLFMLSPKYKRTRNSSAVLIIITY